MSALLAGIDLEVFRRYAGLALPRHVSYPMPTWWGELDARAGRDLLRESRAAGRDLSLYLHVPFCEHSCRYCACTRVLSRRDAPGEAGRVERYVAALERELEDLGAALGGGAQVRQIHWGGGTPAYLGSATIERIHAAIGARFAIAPRAEIAIELDPRTSGAEDLAALRRAGINRLSLGVQDFDPKVQEHVARIQPFEMVRDLVAAGRELGFASINFDLIYGLPYQSAGTIRATLARTVELGPDRIAYYQYAQIPSKIALQRGLDDSRLPDSEAKLEMFLIGLEMLERAGYEFIGLDHFARPEEGLAAARRAGTLQRNFQGMTTGADLDLIGVGASSISHLRGLAFAQNVRDPGEYVERIERDGTAIYRGKRFTRDDLVRQGVLNELYCLAEVHPARIEERCGIVFSEYFARELELARTLAGDGLLVFEPDGRLRVTKPLGRVLLRTVAALFDAYLDPQAFRVGDREFFSANA